MLYTNVYFRCIAAMETTCHEYSLAYRCPHRDLVKQYLFIILCASEQAPHASLVRKVQLNSTQRALTDAGV